MDAEHTIERRLAMDPERVDILESIERLAADQALVGDHEFEFARVTGDEEVADDADQDECDRHERAIGENRIGDDECEEDGRDHQSARVGPDMDVFRSAPRKDRVADEHWFHRNFRFFYYTTFVTAWRSRERGRQAGEVRVILC